MVFVIVIPLTIVAVLGISGYLIYNFIILDFLRNRSLNNMLKKYAIKETPFEIIQKYYQNKDQSLSPKEISRLVKQYKKEEPEQFLAMYDSIRDKSKSD
jgi:hypothetical protein